MCIAARGLKSEPAVDVLSAAAATRARWSRYFVLFLENDERTRQYAKAVQERELVAVSSRSELARSCDSVVDRSYSLLQSADQRSSLPQSDLAVHVQAADQGHPHSEAT